MMKKIFDRTQINADRRRFTCLLIVSIGLAMMLGACSMLATPTPQPTPTDEPTATLTPTIVPTATATATATRTATPQPTNTSTSTPRPSTTATPVRTRTATPTKAPVGPSPTPSIAQICANYAKQVGAGIYVMYIHPEPELIWDTEPRYFKVGLCNTNQPPAVPQGNYKIAMTFPTGSGGGTQSSPSPAELKPGFNEVSVGPWVPGLRNHRADCASRADAYTQVTYNDSGTFRPLMWMDGSDHIVLTIKCGGNFP